MKSEHRRVLIAVENSLRHVLRIQKNVLPDFPTFMLITAKKFILVCCIFYPRDVRSHRWHENRMLIVLSAIVQLKATKIFYPQKLHVIKFLRDLITISSYVTLFLSFYFNVTTQQFLTQTGKSSNFPEPIKY